MVTVASTVHNQGKDEFHRNSRRISDVMRPPPLPMTAAWLSHPSKCRARLSSLTDAPMTGDDSEGVSALKIGTR